jgi:hypothetical protein
LPYAVSCHAFIVPFIASSFARLSCLDGGSIMEILMQ